MTIYFDKSCPYWSKDDEMNRYFLNHQMDYVMDLIKHRGYIYLNQIYEQIGVEWDTERENICIKNLDFTVVIGLDDKHDRWTIDID